MIYKHYVLVCNCCQTEGPCKTCEVKWKWAVNYLLQYTEIIKQKMFGLKIPTMTLTEYNFSSSKITKEIELEWHLWDLETNKEC